MAKRDIRVLRLTEINDPGAPDLPISSYDIGSHKYVMGENTIPLVQAFLTNLITDEGSDAIEEDRGGGLLALVGQYRRFDTSLQSEITSRVRRVENRMLEEQEERTMAPKERLDHVDILRIEQGDQPDEVEIDLAIYPEEGDVLEVRL